ncbi:MAG: DUF3575 domain-containing protein, partial [Muribaculaceae bacterium]|nr:DUF3575 domain-containing protein [Muribaculaceae bacterium]
MRQYLIALAFLLCSSIAYGARVERTTEFRVDFRVSSNTIDGGYSDNAARIAEIVRFLNEIVADDSVEVVSVSFCGMSSPEGSSEFNRKLSLNRLAALEKVISGRVKIPESLIQRDASYIPWDYLRQRVRESDLAS